MRFHTLILVSIISTIAVGCNNQQNSEATNEDARQSIDQLNERHVQAARTEDVEAFLATVTDDFALMPPNNPGARGKEGVRTWFDNFFGAFSIESIEFPTIELVIDRNWAFQHYTYDWTVVPDAGGDSIRDKGDGMYIYHREGDGSWKIAHDIWTSSEPLTGSN